MILRTMAEFDAYLRWRDEQSCQDCGKQFADRKEGDTWASETLCMPCLEARCEAKESAMDFDQVARRLTDQANAITPLTKGMIYYDIKDALRDVWNVRGAADRALLRPEFSSMLTKDLDEALRKLDR